MMDIEQISDSILLPAIISAGIAIFNNRRQKRMEFNYDFRKHILQKRKDAYEKVEAVLNCFKTMHYPNGRAAQEFYIAIDKTNNPLSAFNEYVNNAINNSLWLSVDMSEALRYLSQTIISQQHTLLQKGATIENLAEIGIEENERMLKFHSAILSIFFKDMANLDDIDLYRKEKQKEIDKLIEDVNSYIDAENSEN